MSALPGPWEPGNLGTDVWAPNAKIGGLTKIADVRGWGYLTGKGAGALALSDDDARAIQAANARLIAAAPEMLAVMKALVARNVADNPLRTADVHDHGCLCGRCMFDAAEAVIRKAEGKS